MGSVGLGCFWVFSLTFGIGVICWGAKDTPLWLRRTRGHVPPSPSRFFPSLGLPPNPCWCNPHLPHPWVQPQTLLPVQIWVFFPPSYAQAQSFKELADALSPEPPFLSKIPSPCNSWSQISVLFSQTGWCHSWILGCHGAAVATCGHKDFGGLH